MWDVSAASPLTAHKKMPRNSGALEAVPDLGGGLGTDWTACRALGAANDYYFLALARLALAAGCANWVTAVFRLASNASTACFVVLVSCS